MTFTVTFTTSKLSIKDNFRNQKLLTQDTIHIFTKNFWSFIAAISSKHFCFCRYSLFLYCHGRFRCSNIFFYCTYKLFLIYFVFMSFFSKFLLNLLLKVTSVFFFLYSQFSLFFFLFHSLF